MHMIMWVMSDRAIPRSFRFMEGFGVHTFRLVNADGKSTFVKFHWKPKQALQSVVWNEAVKINGADPLLQGRNFSYLDTQLKRLGGPNFTHIPINAPRCPFANFQQDGHMAMRNPVGRVNYEPNSWSGPDKREQP